jgi:hypothetical protein
MLSRVSFVLLLAFSLSCAVIGQKQDGRYLSDIPLYRGAKYKVELDDEKPAGVRVYSRIYQTRDKLDKVIEWYEQELPDAKKTNGVRSGSPWVFFEFEPEGARDLPALVKRHSSEFVAVRIEKNLLNSATDISIMEFVVSE